MRLVIDVQGALGVSRGRGIGRYITDLTRALIKTGREHEIFLLANGAFEDGVDALRAEFADLLAADRIRVWFPPQPCHAGDPGNRDRRLAAKLSLEVAAANLQPDVFLVGSVFEGLGEDAAPTIGRLGRGIATAAIIYDLIPLINASTYLPEGSLARAWYAEQLEELKRADRLLAISESTASEARAHLELPPHRVHAIGTACNPRFRPLEEAEIQRAELSRRFGLNRPFLMYTGGIDYRKNIEGLLATYARLSTQLRASHQLAIVCHVDPQNRSRLLQLCGSLGLRRDEVIFTGFVKDEELVRLYNACKAFVFPSWHEGFGLPALEAMSCGRAVIASDRTSLPEVVGRPDALFDPFDSTSMLNAIERVLSDDAYRHELEAHGLIQARRFSWEASAQRAWNVFDDLVTARRKSTEVKTAPCNLPTISKRPRLAFVSPVRPAKTGVADYVAELLPELAKYYAIDLIVAQEEPPEPLAVAAHAVRSVDWLLRNVTFYDRVLYQIGNSTYHSHMFDLIRQVPGAVVLHDPILSDIQHLDEFSLRRRPGAWTNEMLHHLGWQRFAEAQKRSREGHELPGRQACARGVIEHSLGVVVHSRFAAEILQAAYPSLGCEVVVSPHLRKLPPASHLASKKEARNLLGLGAEEFVVCSFGLVTPHKLPERVLEAWKLSALSRSQRAQLVFVGDCPATDWGRQFRLTLAEYSRFRARSTGRTTVEQYNLWLRAADVAIQLRHDSRGETSGAALDALAHGLPLIVNEHGSSSELPADVVIRVSEDADPTQLANALDRLASDATLRSTLSARARNHIQEEHDPARCAERMYFSIERFYAAPTSAAYAAITYWAGAADHITQSDQEKFADSLAFSHPARHHRPQLLLDVSELVQRDLKSGIQRVTRLLATYLLRNPPSGFDVHLVYATQETTGYRYAKNFTQTLLKTDFGPMLDDPVEVQPNDCFIALDLQPEILPVQAPLLRRWRTYGVRTYVFVYDLLPLLFPSYFPEGMHPRFLQWLQTLNCFDGAICISRSVADDVGRWMLANFPAHRRMPFSLHWIHLGADFLTDDATSGLPVGNGRDRAAIRTKPCFLMVGTIEPRKGHALVLAAFERLWRAGYDFGLVVAGRPGWCTESLLHRLRNHPRRHKNLFLLESPSDRLLDELYSDCFCLIAASEGEGFGLPLVEAARKGLPLLARDIPVFREVVGNHGRYFSENATPRELARCLRDAHRDITQKNYPSSCGVTTRTWSDVAASVTKIVLGAQPPYRLVTPGVRQWVYFGNDPRLHSHVGERRGWSMLSRREAGFLIFGPFLSLAAGTYRVRFRGSCVATVGSELFEVVENPSSPALAALIVPGGLRDAYSIAFEFQLENDSPSLEFRVWVDAQSELSVEEISVQAIN